MALLDIVPSGPFKSNQAGVDGQGTQGSSVSSSPPSSGPSNSQESTTNLSSPEIADTTSALAPLTELAPESNLVRTGDGGESDDDDAYQVWNINPEKPRKITERRRADNALFHSWIRKNQDELSKKKPDPAQDPQFLSAARMVKESHNKKIIQSPREYQIELFERAKKRNTIIVLGTGAGKTLIAAMLLRHTLEKELEDRAAGKQKKVSFFLVEKVFLVFQQHAVIESNLDLPVGCYCGEMVDYNWSKDFWVAELDKQMAIVCTAAILQKMLSHSFIRINQINLLIFDECHHAKKNHSYARIIKDYYVREPNKADRPRILGLTASPADAQVDMKHAAIELETILHSEIATVSDEVLSSSEGFNYDRHIESQEQYEPLPQPFDTPLCQAISLEIADNKHFRAPLETARRYASELGPWCADHFWELRITEAELAWFIARVERDAAKLNPAFPPSTRAAEAVKRVDEIIKNHLFSAPSLTCGVLSDKVLVLRRILSEAFSIPNENRCIVFVAERHTAKILQDMFEHPEVSIPFLKPAALIGKQSASGLTMSFRDQIATILKFKHGDYNCLFSTSVGEEGLDIPDCNIVVRFDLFNSVIQYIQSKGRARTQNSRYIVMRERGNADHTRRLAQASYDNQILRKFCAALPEDRKVAAFDAEGYIRNQDVSGRYFKIPSTGAKLILGQALAILGDFVGTLPHSEFHIPRAEYIVTTHEEQFICEVVLPSSSPIRSKVGHPQRSKALARSSAAFELCLDLIKTKHIDEHLRSTLVKKLPALRNARLAISGNKRQQYNLRMKPEIWSNLGPATELFATALALSNAEAVGRPSVPLILLTREPLPQLPEFPLFFESGKKSLARSIPLKGSIKLIEHDVAILKRFTFRIFDDVFSKQYEADIEQVPYFLAPTTVRHIFDFLEVDDPNEVINWEYLREIDGVEFLAWENDSPEDFFRDKFVIDPLDGSRKLFLRGVRKDLKPLDPVPDGVPNPGYNAWKAVEHNIKEYSWSAWAASRAKRSLRDDQPVMEAELASLRRNLLDQFFENKEQSKSICYVILEPLCISALTVEIVAMAFAFPAIIHRIESNLIALDACNLLGLRIRPELALEAMTKDSDNTDEQGTEQVNFQRGMGNNYERLEFLGDSFLKMATTIAIYSQEPESNEFEYHVERMLLICNQNLFNTAVDLKLQEYVRSKSFNRRTWYPEGLKLKRGKATRTQDVHSLSDKSIADVCEALIGAAYLSRTEKGDFDMAVRAVSAVAKNKKHQMMAYDEYYAGYKMPAWQTSRGTATQRELARQIREQMGYAFKSPALVRCAFKHPSYPQQYEDLPSYQCLEFLGDALIDMVVVDFLFRHFPAADPQWLTEHKMAMVSNQFLGLVAVKLGFHRHIVLFGQQLREQILVYARKIKEAEIEAEMDAAGGKLKRDYWTKVDDTPKCLPDVVEAYVGAVFVDSGFDYSTVTAFFEAHIRPWFENMAPYDDFASKHPVTHLARRMDQELRCTDWRLLVGEVAPSAEEAGVRCLSESRVACGLMVHGKVVAHAVAASSRYAKIAAAQKAVKKLEGVEKEAFKTEWGCDCELDGEVALAEHGTAI